MQHEVKKTIGIMFEDKEPYGSDLDHSSINFKEVDAQGNTIRLSSVRKCMKSPGKVGKSQNRKLLLRFFFPCSEP